MRQLLWIVCISLNAACSGGKMNYEAGDGRIVAADKAVDYCIAEFERRSGRTISKNIDQLYAIVAPDKIDLLFTKGETGDFGGRAVDLEAFFSCGVLRESPLSLYFLLDVEGGAFNFLVPMADDQKQISDSRYAEPVWHLLFVRRNSRFHFSKLKKFDPVEFQNK